MSTLLCVHENCLRLSSSSVTTTSTVTTLLGTATLSSIHHLVITTTKQARTRSARLRLDVRNPPESVARACDSDVSWERVKLHCSWPTPVLCPCDSSGNNFIKQLCLFESFSITFMFNNVIVSQLSKTNIKLSAAYKNYVLSFFLILLFFLRRYKVSVISFVHVFFFFSHTLP